MVRAILLWEAIFAEVLALNLAQKVRSWSSSSLLDLTLPSLSAIPQYLPAQSEEPIPLV